MVFAWKPELAFGASLTASWAAIGVLWLITPLSWLYLLWTLISLAPALAAGRPASSGALRIVHYVVLSYCCLEVPFSVYYRYLAIKANARRASPQYTRKYLRNLLKKSLENGLGEDDFDEDPLEALMLSRVKTHESVRDDRETESIPMMRHRKATIHSTPDLTATALPRVGTNPSYAASDDTSSEKAYAPSFIPTPLSPEDPRARDFRDFLRLWFHNCEFDDICRLDMAEWLAWSLYGQPLDELVAEREAWEKAGHPPLHVDGEPDIDEDGLDIEGDKLGLVEHCVELVEARAARIFPPGRNVDVKVIRLTLDRVRVISRPLILYVFVWSLQKVVITNARRKGMQEKTEGNFRYLIRTPPGWTPDRDGPESKRPLLFIHGLGMGMAQYATLVNHLATSPVFKDRPLFFLVQPHISMSFFSKGYLHPPNQKSLSADVKRVAVRNGFDKSGMTVLSHSNGTMVHGWLLKEIPEMITRSCFVDPVCFALWEPYVCYNFLYASARTPIEYLMRYFVSRELGVALVLQRAFDWSSNLLFPHQIPNLLSPWHSAFFIAGRDSILNPDRVRTYLKRQGVKEAGKGQNVGEERGGLKLHVSHKHGQSMVGAGRAFNQVMAWVACERDADIGNGSGEEVDAASVL